MAKFKNIIAERATAGMIALSALVPGAAGAQGVYTSTGTAAGKFDKTAPVVAIEDIKLFKQTEGAKAITAMTSQKKASDDCYEQGSTTTAQAKPPATPGGMPAPADLSALKALEPEGRALRERAMALEQREQQIEQMRDKAAKDAALKALRQDQQAQERAEEAFQDKQRKALGVITAGAPTLNMGALVPIPGKAGKEIAQAQQRQLQAARDPNVAQCLADVEKRYAVKESPMVNLFQENHFDVADQALKRNPNTTVFVQTEGGQRYNVVSRSGPYSSRIQALEPAMRQSQQLVASGEAAQFADTGAAPPKPAVPKSKAEEYLEKLNKMGEAAGKVGR